MKRHVIEHGGKKLEITLQRRGPYCYATIEFDGEDERAPFTLSKSAEDLSLADIQRLLRKLSSERPNLFGQLRDQSR